MRGQTKALSKVIGRVHRKMSNSAVIIIVAIFIDVRIRYNISNNYEQFNCYEIKLHLL